MSSADAKAGLKANLIERLHHPMQLRVFVTAVVLLIGYGAVYMPLDSSIADTVRRLSNEERRLNLARDIEFLRNQQKSFQDRVPKQRDPNEWVEYVLS